MTAVLRLSSFVFCLPKLAHRANQCYHTLYIPSAFPSKVLGVGCWVLGFATPPAQHPTPNTRAESALGNPPIPFEGHRYAHDPGDHGDYPASLPVPADRSHSRAGAGKRAVGEKLV